MAKLQCGDLPVPLCSFEISIIRENRETYGQNGEVLIVSRIHGQKGDNGRA